MIAKSITEKLIRSYEGSVVFGGNNDTDDALHNAIKAAAPGVSEERQAELFARLKEGGWDEKRSGVERRMFVLHTVNRWRIDYVHGPAIAAAKEAAKPAAPKKGAKA